MEDQFVATTLALVRLKVIAQNAEVAVVHVVASVVEAEEVVPVEVAVETVEAVADSVPAVVLAVVQLLLEKEPCLSKKFLSQM